MKLTSVAKYVLRCDLVIYFYEISCKVHFCRMWFGAIFSDRNNFPLAFFKQISIDIENKLDKEGDAMQQRPDIYLLLSEDGSSVQHA